MPRREELERVWAWVLEAGSPARQVVRAQRALQDLAAETEASVRRQWEVRILSAPCATMSATCVTKRCHHVPPITEISERLTSVPPGRTDLRSPARETRGDEQDQAALRETTAGERLSPLPHDALVE